MNTKSDIHTALRFYIPGAVIIFTFIVFNLLFPDQFNLKIMILKSFIKSPILYTVGPIAVGAIFSLVWRGLHEGFLYRKSGDNDYLNARKEEMRNLYNKLADKKGKRTRSGMSIFIFSTTCL